MNLTLNNQGRKVKMTIVPYVTTIGHNGRRGSPRINPGTTIFCLKYEHPSGGYYPYSYLDKSDAQKCIENGKFYGTDTEFYMEWNRVSEPELTMHVAHKGSK